MTTINKKSLKSNFKPNFPQSMPTTENQTPETKASVRSKTFCMVEFK